MSEIEFKNIRTKKLFGGDVRARVVKPGETVEQQDKWKAKNRARGCASIIFSSEESFVEFLERYRLSMEASRQRKKAAKLMQKVMGQYFAGELVYRTAAAAK
jgi:hypothetical protein